MYTDAPTAPDQPPLFRPSKKRKIYRQRATSAPTTAIPHSPAEGATSSALPPQSPPSTAAVAVAVADDDDTAPSTAAIRRLLASRRQRGGGVEFRASNPRGADDAEEVEGEGAVVVVRRESHDDGHNEEGGLAMGGKRFVTQTGMSAEGVDRHMMAYIDSELAKRLKPAGISSADTSTPPSTSATTTGADAATASQSQRQHQPSPPYQTASRGKLMEIELPPSSTTPAPPRAAVRKPRLGRDGKPLRGKKRRTEEDIRRDNLVESIMQENGLGIYESPPFPQPPQLVTEKGMKR
ncbi:hypothetical protein GMDG_08046 [Pseudogymnoascus destructans 20631-21]|uniref:Uncharacterized protein n=1 Tax=Pseudogymnoascus destructans (strain ATCC MYA-4855 / 20631-21) TaxID=658429 RepID=L8G1K1_PSED2|nr:hypothetical protein GMDG_08046 [Pseudogymnoascus destructans 20631-21]